VVDCAVIFDVDGVLLELTRDEEEIFFQSLAKFVPTENLSRDWNSYAIRNDENIIEEILARNHLPLTLKQGVIDHYIATLGASKVNAIAIEGAANLLATLQPKAQLGIATANLLAAAEHRLQQVQLWSAVEKFAHGADGGGHKSDILDRAIKNLNLPPQRIVYIGDNINDVTAGLTHGVRFIGFSTDANRRQTLANHGAIHISANHLETTGLVLALLA
jgi:HAD superfamily hydrolase (TIGR01549 family)